MAILPSCPTTIETHSYLPNVRPWQQTCRKLLRSISTGFIVGDEAQRDLNITVNNQLNLTSAASSIAATTTVNALLKTEHYQWEMRSLGLNKFLERGRGCTTCCNWISSLLREWAETIAKQASDQVKVLR